MKLDLRMHFKKTPNILQPLISIQSSRPEESDPNSSVKTQNMDSRSAAPTDLLYRSIPIVPMYFLM